MEDLDHYQFREERVSRGGRRAIQSLNVTDRNTVGSDESSRTKHFLSVYTDEEKEWLLKTDKEERGKGRGFMKPIKEKSDAKYPNRNNVSTQNLKDNAGRFRFRDPTQLMKSNKRWWTKTATQITQMQLKLITNGQTKWN